MSNEGCTILPELINHIESHTDVKAYVYNSKNGFVPVSDQIIGNTTHTDMKLYICDVCNKEFNN